MIQYLEVLLLKNKNDEILILEIADLFVDIEIEREQVVKSLLDIFSQDSSEDFIIDNGLFPHGISVKEKAKIILTEVYKNNSLVKNQLLPLYEEELNSSKDLKSLVDKILLLNPNHLQALKILEDINKNQRFTFKLPFIDEVCNSMIESYFKEDYKELLGNFHKLNKNKRFCERDNTEKYYESDIYYEEYRQSFFSWLNKKEIIKSLGFLVEKIYEAYLDSWENGFGYSESYDLEEDEIINILISASKILNLCEASHPKILSIFQKIFEDCLETKSLFNEELMIEIGFYLARFSSEKSKYYNLLLQKVLYRAGINQFTDDYLYYDYDLFYEDILFDNIYNLIRKTLIEEPILFSLTVQNLSKFIPGFDEELNKNNDSPPIHYKKMFLYSILWFCSENMNYSDFYKAWHSQPEIIHPEILEISPLGNTSITQTLNQQILDLPSQLQPTEKTYPLVINAQSLEDETDNSSIAQELCNQIYAIVFPDEINIPEINNAPQLKRLIPNLKKQLNTQNLALIFHNAEPNESLTKFCKKLTDAIHIKWITEQPIAYGIPPQENLVNILQNWINQLD